MRELLLFFQVLFGVTREVVKEPIDYCQLDRSHLTLDQKIEMGLGCSTVNGKNAYSDQRLKWWYNEGKPYDTDKRIELESKERE